MSVGLGRRIRDERKQRGWNQDELARRIGDVGQQAVSRWERGLSRPTQGNLKRLTALLEFRDDELLETADATLATAEIVSVTQPVRPHLPVLPVAELSPETFEDFVADIAKQQYPTTAVSRFGGQGDKQEGVDVIAQGDATTVATFQCKRRTRFGPQHVRDAVAAVTIEAERHFLVLSRPSATAASRKEMGNHRGWTLWDARDLTRELRALPGDAAVRIVDTYFQGWREPLLGVRDPGAWLTTAERFPSSGPDHIYPQDLPLVGRSKELLSILSFASGEGERIGLLIGRGGIGKHRLLREVGLDAPAREITVRFAAPGVELLPAHVESLPPDQGLLVVIDNAHSRLDLEVALTTIARIRPRARILLALRPHGLSTLTPYLRHVGVHHSEIPTWHLNDLTHRESEQLAREALGPDWPLSVARRLGALTADCPLITVAGGVLIRRGKLDPTCLDHQDTIHETILAAFRQALVAEPLSSDEALRSAAIDALAILQPFRSDDPPFQTAMAQLTGAPFDRAVGHLRALEDAGVVLRRGSALRIVPDLLGDVILSQACLQPGSGASTGYVERARRSAGGEPLQHIFVNAARLDWQFRHDRDGAPSLAVALWDAVEQEVSSADTVGLTSLLQLLRKVSLFEPARTLAIARWIVDNQAGIIERTDGSSPHPLSPTITDVLRHLPPTLRAAAYNVDYLPTVADLLWELAQADERPTNPHPDHALRVLQELAEYEAGKPLAVNQLMIDAAERWLKLDDQTRFLHSPFDVIEPLLATEGAEHRTEASVLSIRPYALSVESVMPLRERVIGLALDEARSTDPRRGVRGVRTIEAGLHYPFGLVGRQISDEERDRWTPIFVETIRQLGAVTSDSSRDPVVSVAARRALSWHAGHSKSATRAAARRVLRTLPASLEHQVALALFDGFGHLTSTPTNDYQRSDAENQSRVKDLVDSLIADRSNGAVIELLTRRLISQQLAFATREGNPGLFVWTLVNARPSIGLEICARVESEPESVLSEVLAVALSALASECPTEAMNAISGLLRTNDRRVRGGVAQALGWNRGLRTTLLEGELNLLAELARDPDESVRLGVVRAAQRLARDQKSAAVALITEVPFADSATVADAVLQLFGPRGELEWQPLPSEQAEGMLLQLRDCPSIEGYNTTSFLSHLAEDRPAAVIRLLEERIERSEQINSIGTYRALPVHWGQVIAVRGNSDFAGLLRQIRGWIAAKADSWHRQEMGAELFRTIAGPFDTSVVRVLDEGLSSGESDQVSAVAAILRKAPRDVVFNEVEFVRRALRAASRSGEIDVRRVAGALHTAASSGLRTGILGQPFELDVEQRDRAREIAAELPQGSVEHNFYQSMAEATERYMRWYMTLDEQFADGRDW